MFKVTHRVQAHPERALMAAALAVKIGGDVCYDPDPDNPIRHPWRTYRHLLETADPEATHISVIQDDAIVCGRYAEAVELAVAARPDRILVFFVGGNPRPHALAVLNACRADRPWAELGLGPWLPVVANVWPREIAQELLDWDASHTWPPKFISDDERCGRFVQWRKINALASVPSLVEHPDVAVSLLGKKARGGADPGRIAACWIGSCDECTDPTTIDWTRGPGG